MLIEDETVFKRWFTPQGNIIHPVARAKRGIPIFTAILFKNPGVDENGLCNVTYDIVVRRPDNKIYGEIKDLIGWNAKRIDHPEAMYLGTQYMGVRIEPEDPSGNYTFEVHVKANVRQIHVSLKHRFLAE